jgi:hypothetical protein
MEKSLAEIVRNKSDSMKKRHFMREYNFTERDIHSLLYNGRATANRALKVLRAFGYDAPNCAVTHLKDLLHKPHIGSMESVSVVAGYDRQTIQRWKNGEFNIGWFHFRAMCDALECPIVSKLPK